MVSLIMWNLLDGGAPLLKQGEKTGLELLDSGVLSTALPILRYAPRA